MNKKGSGWSLDQNCLNHKSCEVSVLPWVQSVQFHLGDQLALVCPARRDVRGKVISTSEEKTLIDTGVIALYQTSYLQPALGDRVPTHTGKRQEAGVKLQHNMWNQSVRVSINARKSQLIMGPVIQRRPCVQFHGAGQTAQQKNKDEEGNRPVFAVFFEINYKQSERVSLIGGAATLQGRISCLRSGRQPGEQTAPNQGACYG